MIAHPDERQDYFRAQRQCPQPYLLQGRRKLDGYAKRHAVQPAKPREPRIESLESLFKELQGEELAGRIYTVRQGREVRVFENDPLLPRLVSAIKARENAKLVVEKLLDHLFEDLRKGDDFVHTEIVMFLLLALKRAEVVFFTEIATVFSENKSSELGRLRRVAKTLLEQ